MQNLGMKSCYHCDNFSLDRFTMEPSTKQETLSEQKYSCKRKYKIKVMVQYSHIHTSSDRNNNNNISIHNKEEKIGTTDHNTTTSNLLTVNCKYGQWKRYSREALKEM